MWHISRGKIWARQSASVWKSRTMRRMWCDLQRHFVTFFKKSKMAKDGGMLVEVALLTRPLLTNRALFDQQYHGWILERNHSSFSETSKVIECVTLIDLPVSTSTESSTFVWIPDTWHREWLRFKFEFPQNETCRIFKNEKGRHDRRFV